MSKVTGKAKHKPGTNVDFVQIIPKFLQGKMQAQTKPRNPDDSDDEENRPVIVQPQDDKQDRPELEDEAPTIVADDEIMALLCKQELVVADGKLERKISTKEDSVDPTSTCDEVTFGKKRTKRMNTEFGKEDSKTSSEITSSTENHKKRPSTTDPEAISAKKRNDKKKMLSFDDTEDF